MTKRIKTVVGVLLVLNCIVLLGQIWPDGAPPFARSVNIGFLALNLAFLITGLTGRLTPTA